MVKEVAVVADKGRPLRNAAVEWFYPFSRPILLSNVE